MSGSSHHHNPAASRGWARCTDPSSGRVFYANRVTRKTQWEAPPDWVEDEPPLPKISSGYSNDCSPAVKESDNNNNNNNNPAASRGWAKSTDPSSGRVFYANRITRKTQWEAPPDWVEDEPPLPKISSSGCNDYSPAEESDYNNNNKNNSNNSGGGGGNTTVGPVTLHVYEFQPDPSEHPPGSISGTDRALLALSGILPKIGMGAYHTCLEVMGSRYTFVGVAGVVAGRASGPDVGVPGGARYSASIELGTSPRTKDELDETLKRLSVLFFTPSSYNLVHRNCNHFTETLAMALVLSHEELSSMPNNNHQPSSGGIIGSGSSSSRTTRLSTFPRWLNRLANTSAMVVAAPERQGTGSSSCDVPQEARIAAGY